MAGTALIFDVDGVIIDSTDTHTAAWVKYLNSHGIEENNLAARMLGKHNDELVRMFFGQEDLEPHAVMAHGAAKEALYRDMIRAAFDSHLVPGVAGFVRKHAGMPLAVASNAERANVDFVLELSGLRSYFQVAVSGADVKRPKPFPDIYLRAASLLSVDPGDFVVFEDSLTGVEAARAAGMRVVGLMTTLERFDNVDKAIRHFEDDSLEEWLQCVMAERSL